jgi:hypothetical protein
MKPSPSKRKLEPWTDSRPEPLELLARLAGNTAFRLPGSGGMPTLTTEDIAHALGCVRSERAKTIALAIATGNRHAWPNVHLLAYPRLISELQGDRRTRQFVSGADKFRARIVLHTAFHDLVAWQEPNWKDGALGCGMTQRDYKTLYYSVSGFLRTDAVAAAYQACAKLFGKKSDESL